MGRGKTVSPEIRKLIIEWYNQEKTPNQIGKELKLSRSTVGTIIGVFKKRGNVSTKFKGRQSKVSARDSRKLRNIVVVNRRETAAAINLEWKEAIKKSVSTSTCKRTLKKMGFGFYKVRHTISFVILYK